MHVISYGIHLVKEQNNIPINTINLENHNRRYFNLTNPLRKQLWTKGKQKCRAPKSSVKL